MIRAQITIRLKTDVLDPEGKAIESALGNLGFTDFGNVRKGKIIELTLDDDDSEQAQNKLQDMCEKLLCNLVIEEYQIQILTP